MYTIHLHKSAQKALQKAPPLIKEKSLQCFLHLTKSSLQNFPYPITPLQGKYKKFKYLEIKLSKDYRIILRKEGNVFFIRYAGTYNSLGTG